MIGLLEGLKCSRRNSWRSPIGIRRISRSRGATLVQYGALPYRLTKTRSIELLLVTSREAKRWIIPKGWPIDGLKPFKSAAQEAYEEAGIHGIIGKRPSARTHTRRQAGAYRAGSLSFRSWSEISAGDGLKSTSGGPSGSAFGRQSRSLPRKSCAR